MLSKYINMNCVSHLVVINIFEDQCPFFFNFNAVAISELCIVCDFIFFKYIFVVFLLIPCVGLSLHSVLTSLQDEDASLGTAGM